MGLRLAHGRGRGARRAQPLAAGPRVDRRERHEQEAQPLEQHVARVQRHAHGEEGADHRARHVLDRGARLAVRDLRDDHLGEAREHDVERRHAAVLEREPLRDRVDRGEQVEAHDVEQERRAAREREREVELGQQLQEVVVRERRREEEAEGREQRADRERAVRVRVEADVREDGERHGEQRRREEHEHVDGADEVGEEARAADEV